MIDVAAASGSVNTTPTRLGSGLGAALRAALLVTALGALAGCGQRADLKPRAGKEMPPPPYGRADRPKSAELLETPTLAIPKRSVELRTRSEERDDDPFDLPPPENIP